MRKRSINDIFVICSWLCLQLFSSKRFANVVTRIECILRSFYFVDFVVAIFFGINLVHPENVILDLWEYRCWFGVRRKGACNDKFFLLTLEYQKLMNRRYNPTCFNYKIIGYIFYGFGFYRWGRITFNVCIFCFIKKYCYNRWRSLQLIFITHYCILHKGTLHLPSRLVTVRALSISPFVERI